MNPRLVLVGGGHAHMVTLANLHLFTEKGIGVTVIQPSEHHYYSGMGPGMLGMTYSPEDIRFATKKVVEKKGGTFVQGKALAIDPEKKEIHLESGDRIPYDAVSFNAGSFIPKDIVSDETEDLFLVKPIERLKTARERIISLSETQPVRVAVIGGGPSAVEISGNVWGLGERFCRHPPRIKLFCGKRLISRAPEKVALLARKSLEKRGIEISFNTHIEKIEKNRIFLKSGTMEEADIIFLALGIKPSNIFSNSGLPTGPDGGLLVNRFLQSPRYPDIFGGGDCIFFENHPLDKVGVYAVRQNPVLYHNLMAYFDNTPLIPFEPGGDYLLIYNLGDGTGILYKWSIMFGGKPAFKIKDYIDRKFMAKFQAIEK
jgi:NADH dehydrogenase FAD-containing subunit